MQGVVLDHDDAECVETQHAPLKLPGLWEVYAGAKYQGRDLRGLRDLTDKPATLPALGGMLLDLCECSWRSGVKPAELVAAARDELRQRRK